MVKKQVGEKLVNGYFINKIATDSQIKKYYYKMTCIYVLIFLFS